MRDLIRGGIRYISHMFDEKEPEMEIGLPTDVKHVAHIGWEGPDASKPSWMNEFHNKSAPEYENASFDSLNEDVVSGVAPNSTGEKPKHRSKKSSAAANSPMNSPVRRSTDGTKYSKRSAATGSPMNLSPKQNRLSRNLMSPKQSPGREQSAAPKHSRRRKSKKDKNSSKDGSEASEPKSRHVKKSYANHLSSVLEAYEDEKPTQHKDKSPKSRGMMMVENSEFPTSDAKAEYVGVYVS